MAPWAKSCRNTPGSRETPILRKCFSAPRARPASPHDRSVDLPAGAVAEEPVAGAAASVEKTQVSGGRGRGRGLFLFLLLPALFCRTPAHDRCHVRNARAV